MSAMNNNRWSPFDPKWYQAAFDQYTGTAEELFNTDFIIQQGFHVPDSDGSRNSIFRDSAVLNNTFNEQDVRDTLTDIYLNTTHRLAASNHDNTHFFSWYGTMSDFTIIPNTKYCEMVIPFDQFINAKERDLYKLRQFYRKWITVQDILNNWDVFKWHCMLFINKKVHSEYLLRMDEHSITIRFEYVPYWYKKNVPVYIFKLDTNAQCRVKISRELCENQWDWKVPLDYIPEKRILNSKNIIVAFNKISDPDHRKDGLERVEVLGDNLEFLQIENGCIDLTNISNFNRQYIRSEKSEYLWMSIVVPKFFHEYPILLPADVIYRPYEANFQKVSIVEGDFVQHVKADVSGDRSADQLYVDMNGGPGEEDNGWAQMIRPIVLSDAYDGTFKDPYVNFLDDLRKLRDATVAGADLVEQMRFDVADALVNDKNLDPYLDKLVESMTNIHDIHNGFLDNLLIEYNQDYELKFKNFLSIVSTIRTEGSKAEWLHANQKSEKNFWNIVSPLIHIPRSLVDKYNIIETTSMVEQNPVVWHEHEQYSNKWRYQHPIAEEDFWVFEYSTASKVWRPTRLSVKHYFPDVYLLSDPTNNITGRIFKAFFFYSDTMNVRRESRDISRATPDWEKDVQEYHINQMSSYRDIFMEKFYWMGVRAIYRGYLLTNNRWEALEYVIDNDSYTRFNDLFMKTVDPYFKLGMATYLKSENFGFPFDDAIAKMQEAMGTKWLGYRKLTNFEQYLNKNWDPSYVDSIVEIDTDFDPGDRLVRRPRRTFDAGRILPILLLIQERVHLIAKMIDDELEWIIARLEEENYNLILDYFRDLKDKIGKLNVNIDSSIDFINGLDEQLYSVDDVNKIIVSIQEYLNLLDEIETALRIVDNDASMKNHHARKHGLLLIINSTIATLSVYINRVLEIVNLFDMDAFMKGANDVRSYILYNKENPDDNSLLGHINEFTDAWSDDVKEKRDKFFSSSAVVYGTFVPGRSYSSDEIYQFLNMIYKAREDLKALRHSVNEFYRIFSRPVNQTVIDRLDYTEENLDTLALYFESYIEARQALIDQFNIIRGCMMEYKSFVPGNTENGFIDSMNRTMDDILTALSYIASSGDQYGANSNRDKMAELGKTWTGFVDFEEQVFDRIFRIVHPPVEFLEQLRSYEGILKAILDYLQTVNWDFVPDAYLAKYSDVYEVDGIEVVNKGFNHKVTDEVYVPDLGSFHILSVDDPEVGSAGSMIKLRYRCTTFRDPMIQEMPYDSTTSGDGLGIMVKPTSSTKTPIVCDDIMKVFLQKIDNILYLVEQSASTPNPYDNYNLQDVLDSISDISSQWESIKETYRPHISPTYRAAIDDLTSFIKNLESVGTGLIQSRETIKLKDIIDQSNKLVDASYEKASELDKADESYLYYENPLIDAIRSIANFYGNGSAWEDGDLAVTILGELISTWDKFVGGTEAIRNDENLSKTYDDLKSLMESVIAAFPKVSLDMEDLLRASSKIREVKNNLPAPRNDEWYRIYDVRIAAQGNYYKVGDIVQIVPKLPLDNLGNEITEQEDLIMDDVILLRVTAVDDGHVTEVVPLMDYAIPYKIWGIRETIAKFGDGRGLSIDVYTKRINSTDIIDYQDENSDVLKPNQYNETDMISFKFENIHDLDIHYEVFIGGKQINNFIQRHETVSDPKRPRDIDVIYVPANSVMALKNNAITKAAENYLIYRIKDVIVKDPGAGYCLGQEVFVDAGIVSLRLRVTGLDGTPLKGIASMSISSGNMQIDGENPSASNVKIVPDSMNNIDDEYNTGYYDRLPKDGIEKAATFSYPKEEYTFVAKRFDDLEDGDRNKTFMYPDVGTPEGLRGDPDEKWYLGSRIDNSQVPETDKRIYNGIMNLIPPTHPFIPDALRIPPGVPIKGEYQRVMDIRLNNCSGSSNINPVEKSEEPLVNTAMRDYDLEVDTFADLPRHTEDWAQGRRGKRILVRCDETHGGHAMLYTIRTFVAAGFFVYELPEVADMAWNRIDVNWMNCDFYPDMPSRKAQYPTAPYDSAKTYQEIDHEITDEKHQAEHAPSIVNKSTYIKDLSVKDLSVFNWTTMRWEDLSDESRWKLTVRDDYEAKDWGFTLELLEDGMYSYNMSLFLNKTPDTLGRNVDLKKDAVVDVKAAVSREVNVPSSTVTINTGRQVRIRKLFPYEQKETFTVSPANYEMDFKMAPYIHFRNEVHLEDIVVYNKTAGRYEDIMDQNLFEVRFKDPKAYRRGTETHTIIDRTMIGDAGSDFVDGEVWAYNAQYGIHVFGTVEADKTGDGHIIKFTPIYCPNIPDETTSMEFQVYQSVSQNQVHAASIVIEFLHETVELFGDGYIHNVTNRMAPVPKEFKVVVKYDLDAPAVYEIIIDKTAKEWEFVYPEWVNTPTFRIKGAPIPEDRIYITTADGRMPLINPDTGNPTFRVTNTTDGMDITILSLYRRYDRIHVHSTPYPMRSVYTLRNIPQSGYIDLKGKLNKPLNHRYYEFWVNGKLLYDEVTIISPTKLFLHGLTSLKNLEIIEVNRDPNEYFSGSFLEVEASANGRPYQSWNYQTYLDDALEGKLEEDNYTLEEQEYLLTPVWKQVERDHPEYKNYPPNVDTEGDILTRIQEDDNILDELANPDYQFSILDVPRIEGQRISGQRLTFAQFGFTPITDDEIIEMLNEEWKDEIADPSIRFPSHAVMSDDEWYGTAARLYDEYGIRVHTLNEAAYKVFDHDLLNINVVNRMIRIIPVETSYDLE